MSDKPAHDAGPDRPGPAGDGETTAASATSREPLVSGDPLGIGGVPDPDAPSRRPRPKIVSLVGEFFKMSRTTAILLVTFVLLSMLYAAVKDEPVFVVGPVVPAPTQMVPPSEPAPAPSSTEQATETSVPTEPTTSAPTEVTTADPESESRQTTTPSSDGQGNRTTQQAPQETQQQPPQQQTPQQQTQQQPQLQPQRVPQGAAAGPAGGGQTAE